MKKPYYLVLPLLLFFYSCGHPITLAPAPDNEVDSLQNYILKRADSAANPSKMQTESLSLFTSSAGSAEDFWKSAFTACYKSDILKDNTLFNHRLLYLSPSNNDSLGTVYDNEGRERNNLNFLPIKELLKFTDTGKMSNSCNLTQVKKMSINFLVGAGVLSSVNADLSVALTSADSIMFTGGAWRVNQIIIDKFEKYLDTSTNQNVKDYKQSLENKNNKVVTVVVKVNGFSAKAFLKSTLAPGLQAQINNKLTAKLDSAKVSLKFNSSNDKTIDISSTNFFYIFANVYKNSSLKQ